MTLKILSVAVAILGFQTALAQETIQGTGLFLEPGVAYQMSHSNLNYPAPMVNSTATTDGFGVLLRGGVHVYERFFVAADGRYNYLKFSDNSNNISSTAQGWDIGPVVGMQMADYGLRLYVGYALAGELDPDSANNFDLKFQQPNGWRVGAGLKIQQLSVNIEWQRLDYNKTVVEQIGSLPAGTTGAGMEYSPEGILASVSFPIEFN